MKLTNSQEEYLKTIYLLEKNQQKVRVTDIAQKMNITKPSVNKALRILKDLKLINYEVYGNIELTNEGGKNAKEIIKKQDTLEIFLIGILGIDKNQAEEEAKAKIAEAKLTYKATFKITDSSKGKGVVEQSISPHSFVDKNSEITITINEYQEIIKRIRSFAQNE